MVDQDLEQSVEQKTDGRRRPGRKPVSPMLVELLRWQPDKHAVAADDAEPAKSPISRTTFWIGITVWSVVGVVLLVELLLGIGLIVPQGA